MKKIKDIGEIKLIERFKSRYKPAKHTLVGIGDDAAVIKPIGAGEFLLFTCDMLTEGIHFLMQDVTGFNIGWKALGAGLSDIAAMGGVPVSAIISLGMPSGTGIDFVDGLIKGINSLAHKFNVDISGGDTVTSPKGIVISIAVIGRVSKKNLVLRRGAKVGDKILVTGTLGGSSFRKQFNFIPRIKEAQWVVSHGKISAMMDITDGLSMDLYRLITESKVGARLYKELIPVSKDALRYKNPLKNALCGGEDFELLLTTHDAGKILDKNISLTVIGEIIKDKGKMEIVDRYGKIKDLVPQGYEHFKQ